MPSFSCRWGLPSCRRKEDNRDRCRGRRPGNAATCRARLKGWIRNVAERSPIWGDVDLKAFCAATGYSREHATRELSKLRRESGFAFETKLRSKRGSKTNTWGVIVADPEKLRFDRRSLFYDRHGNRLHNYTTLADGGEKIAPTIIFPVPERRPRGRPRTRPVVSEVQKRPRGRPRKQCATPLPVAETVAQESPLAPTPAQVLADANGLKKYLEIPRRCDNPLTKDSFGIQQPDLYGAVRGVVLSRGREGPTAKPQGLRRKAFALQARLAGCHWDNCKVRFSRRTAHSYAFRALCDGHDEWRIMACYERALSMRCLPVMVSRWTGRQAPGRSCFSISPRPSRKPGDCLPGMAWHDTSAWRFGINATHGIIHAGSIPKLWTSPGFANKSPPALG